MSTLQSALASQAVKTAFVFPGQGSQKVGMLAELAERFPSILTTFKEASDALGSDLWEIAQTGDKLDQTQYTQPVLLTASIALWRIWLEGGGPAPKYLAGHSLGEYSALVAAEALNLVDAVKLVNLRGQLMQQAVPQGTGAMAAILGLSDEQVITLCQDASQQNKGQVEAANFNAQGQVVIAGATEAVQIAIEKAKELSGKAIVLPVSVPSHCSLMKSASEQFAQALAKVDLQLPKIAVINNVNAQIANDLDSLKQALVNQLYQPVQWTKTLAYLEQYDVQYLVECGSGNVLSNLAKRLPFVSKALPIDTVNRFEDALHTILTAEGKIA
ncbi:ACP S-malonyltransferase [Acinetobacter qingfengensis]|uniref:Malonyl CoA-acyl carrier protein transacylase n=1 Tax=Acinetobacter qingfengensis TaxID=1262585 RepID=A0A1E7RCM0_9GAMM|nr:ACP S-malonyltransferase [Acinetobacter qingfengensis]KAA8734335.1 ACP S-malonyltransferase [Acinetobacter qingfengensis]OEY97098.1 [acyl-carrier-protein] S-malonyltransferase [Acinetobacter qingfengensis]